MELLLLEKLNWELSAVTSLDYLDHVLPRLPVISAEETERVKNVAQTILAVAATDYTFSYIQPSLMAASAVLLGVDRAAVAEVRRRVKAMLHIVEVKIF